MKRLALAVALALAVIGATVALTTSHVAPTQPTAADFLHHLVFLARSGRL
jgi:hypothetical protein